MPVLTDAETDTAIEVELPDFGARLHEVFANKYPELAPEDDKPDATDEDPAPGDEPTPEVDPIELEPAPTTDPVPPVVHPTESPSPAKLSVPIPGTDDLFDLDVPTAERLLALAAWSENLAPQTREQFAAIETGQAVAIARADFDRFRAWQQSQRDEPDELDDVDPRVAQELAQLRAENERLRVAPEADRLSATATDATKTFLDSAASYAQARGLSEDEMGEVFQIAVGSGVIPSIADSMRSYSPSGQVIRDADYAEVAKRAFDYALIQHPSLRERAFAAPAVQADPNPGTDPTAIKKARAGSLASAPSAAVTTTPPDVRAMSQFERSQAMAQEIRAAQGR